VANLKQDGAGVASLAFLSQQFRKAGHIDKALVQERHLQKSFNKQS
jgi:hypothetical protein